MLSLAKNTCQRHVLNSIFSRRISQDAMKKWSLSGAPKPRSLFDDDTPADLSEDSDAVDGRNPDTPPLHRRKPPNSPTPEHVLAHRHVIQKNFPDGWNPPHKLSREAMEGLRQLHHLDKEKFTTPVLAEKFKISPEAVRRILKSRWQPSTERVAKLAERERQRYREFVAENRRREKLEAEQVQAIKQANGRRSKSVADELTLR